MFMAAGLTAALLASLPFTKLENILAETYGILCFPLAQG
jgi:hypothetical protein